MKDDVVARRTVVQLVPTFDSVFAIIPFLITEYMTMRDIAVVSQVNRTCRYAMKRLILKYKQSFEFDLLLENVRVAVKDLDIRTFAGRTHVRYNFMRSHQLLCMPGDHTIEIYGGLGWTKTTQSLLYHQFGRNAKYYMTSAPISSFSMSRVFVEWSDDGTPDPTVRGSDGMKRMIGRISATPRIGLNETLGYGTIDWKPWLLRIVRYLSEFRDTRTYTKTIPSIVSVTFEMANRFNRLDNTEYDEISYSEHAEAMVIYMVSTSLVAGYIYIVVVGFRKIVWPCVQILFGSNELYVSNANAIKLI